MFLKAVIYGWPKHSNVKINLEVHLWLLVHNRYPRVDGLCKSGIYGILKNKQNCEDFILSCSRRNGEADSLEIIVHPTVVKPNT